MRKFKLKPLEADPWAMNALLHRLALLLVALCLLGCVVAQPALAAPLSLPQPGLSSLLEGEEVEAFEGEAEEGEGEEIEVEEEDEESGEAEGGKETRRRHHRRHRRHRHGRGSCHRSARPRPHGCSQHR